MLWYFVMDFFSIKIISEYSNIDPRVFQILLVFLKGPLLHNSDCTSMVVIQRFMKNEFPMVPDVGLAMCDVRDVARAHLAAMILPEAKNHRHMVSSSKQSVSFLDIGQILHEEFTPKNYKIVTTKAPNCVIKIGAIFDKGLRMVIFKLNSHEYSDFLKFHAL